MNKFNAPWKTFSRLSHDGLPEIVVAADNGCPLAVVSDHAEIKDTAKIVSAAPELYEALVEAKKQLWLTARVNWTMTDFKNWAVVQQIDAALEKADGERRLARDLAGAA
jgi:hypothetical protein